MTYSHGMSWLPVSDDFFKSSDLSAALFGGHLTEVVYGKRQTARKRCQTLTEGSDGDRGKVNVD